jgi:hypothetical protein
LLLLFFVFLSITTLSSISIADKENLTLVILSVALMATSLLHEALELHLQHGNNFLEAPILHHSTQNVSILFVEQSDKGLQEVEEGA